jgi:RNA polymerase sigma-70 factor (ECF subfamily)
MNTAPDRFDDLHHAYHARVLAYARRLCRNAEDAEDIAQEAFLRAYSALPRFAIETSFESWIKRITFRVFLDSLRLRNRRVRIVLASELAMEGALEATADSESGADSHPNLSGELDGLTAPERKLLEAAFVYEKSPKEIARDLGKSARWVREELNRLRGGLLRQALLNGQST